RRETFASLALSVRTSYTATHSRYDCLVTLIPARCLAIAVPRRPLRAHVDYPSEDGQPMAESDYGVVRPVIHGEVLVSDGARIQILPARHRGDLPVYRTNIHRLQQPIRKAVTG